MDSRLANQQKRIYVRWILLLIVFLWIYFEQVTLRLFVIAKCSLILTFLVSYYANGLINLLVIIEIPEMFCVNFCVLVS